MNKLLNSTDFPELSAVEQIALIRRCERTQGVFFRTLMRHLIHCYYQHPSVQAAIGVEPRPPFPDGYAVPDGDLLLLEPVFERDRLYR